MAANRSALGRSRASLATVLAILSALAIAVFAARPADASMPTRTMYKYTSETGDYIGGGGTNRYTPANSTISVGGTDGSLTLSVRTATEYWTINLAAPLGEKLHPGVYDDTERASFRTGRAPGLDVSGNHRGCNEIWGSFAINQITTDESGKVTMLDASFTQHCELATAPALEGVVKFKAPPLSYVYRSYTG